ncbi:MAG: hypothetical protein DU429_01105 [Candidatus Tokpelaia sp.]|nr:MAG: hypothetical protein DU430_02735 [Candidatus Tokpelaia sp.]KAA6207674.1 MAG: hypothetical protein DU429_01105 [Candidatus Tokpelaia sp.]KAA6404849.1 hypothetical protein DPQ22_08040 [Candidatus Tokpelaia sp.]
MLRIPARVLSAMPVIACAAALLLLSLFPASVFPISALFPPEILSSRKLRASSLAISNKSARDGTKTPCAIFFISSAICIK